MSRERETGFTLIETLIATAVFGIIMVGAFLLFATNNAAYSRGQSRAEVIQNARVALDTMTREIRVAGYDRSGVIDTLAAPSAIQTAQSNRLVFVADVDRSGTLNQVDYGLVGSDLVRRVASWGGSSFSTPATGELAGGLTVLNFSYFDSSDSAIAAPVASASLKDIHRITVSLATTAVTGREQVDFQLVQDVQLRN